MIFTNHVTVTEWSVSPFNNTTDYLLVSDGHQADCYQLADDAPINMAYLITEAIGCPVTCTTECGGSNYAAIIRSGRPPDSPVVWAACNWWYVEED